MPTNLQQNSKYKSCSSPQNISQGAGPDSEDFESHVKAVEARKRIMKLRREEKMKGLFNWPGNQPSGARKTGF